MASNTIASPAPAWEAVTTAERFARSVMNQYHDEITQPLYRAHEAGIATIQQVFQAEDGWSPYTSARADAVNTVILTPAPDFASVVRKIELGLGDGAFDGSDEAERMLRVLADDIRRIASVGGQA